MLSARSQVGSTLEYLITPKAMGSLEDISQDDDLALLGYSINNLSQRKAGPVGSNSVLTKVTPGHSISLNLGTAVEFSRTFAVNWGLKFTQYEENEYKWQGDLRSKGDQLTTAYFYTRATMTLNNYTFFPGLMIGTTDDSYDFGFSMRCPLL